MYIRLQTSLGNEIPNSQETELSPFELNLSKGMSAKYPNAKFKTGSIPRYNCHGLTFGSRRTRIVDDSSIKLILHDDSFHEIPGGDILPGDIVIYKSTEGEFNHSGIVIKPNHGDSKGPLILSKWGGGPEVIHWLHDVPKIYGSYVYYYRCK